MLTEPKRVGRTTFKCGGLRIRFPWTFTISIIFLTFIILSNIITHYPTSPIPHLIETGTIKTFNVIESYIEPKWAQLIKSSITRGFTVLKQSGFMVLLLERVNFFTHSLNPTQQLKPLRDFFQLTRQGYSDWLVHNYQSNNLSHFVALPCEYIINEWDKPIQSPSPPSQVHSNETIAISQDENIIDVDASPDHIESQIGAEELRNVTITLPNTPRSFWDWVCSVLFPTGLDSICPPAADHHVEHKQHTVTIGTVVTNSKKTNTSSPKPTQQSLPEKPSVPTPKPTTPHNSTTKQPITSQGNSNYPSYCTQVREITKESKKMLKTGSVQFCHKLSQFKDFMIIQHNELSTELPFYYELTQQIINITQGYLAYAREILILNLIFPSFWFFLYQVYLTDLFTLFLHRSGHYFIFTIGIAMGIMIGSIHSLVPIYLINKIKGKNLNNNENNQDDSPCCLKGCVHHAVSVPNGTSGREDLRTNWLCPNNTASPMATSSTTCNNSKTLHTSINTDIPSTISSSVFIIQPDHPYNSPQEDESEQDEVSEDNDKHKTNVTLLTTTSPQKIHATNLTINESTVVGNGSSNSINSSQQQEQQHDSEQQYANNDPNNQPMANYDNSSIDLDTVGLSVSPSVTTTVSSPQTISSKSSNIDMTTPSIITNGAVHSSSKKVNPTLTSNASLLQHQNLFNTNISMINNTSSLSNIQFNSSLWADDVESDDEVEMVRLNKSKLNILQSVQKSKQKLRIFHLNNQDDSSTNDIEITSYDLADGAE